jgi:hypothetical protein
MTLKTKYIQVPCVFTSIAWMQLGKGERKGLTMHSTEICCRT